MPRSSQWLLPVAAILTLGLAACAKGATTLDEDAAQAGPGNRGGSNSGTGDSGSGGAGSSNAGSNSVGSGSTVSDCGNNRIDPDEDCDGSDLGTVTCMNLGFTGGQLACDPMTCMYETSMCTRGSTGTAGNGGM